MNEVIARIDVSTPSGRKIARELDGKKAVKMEYPLPPQIAGQKTYTLEESYNECIDILSQNYGVDISEL